MKKKTRKVDLIYKQGYNVNNHLLPFQREYLSKSIPKLRLSSKSVQFDIGVLCEGVYIGSVVQFAMNKLDLFPLKFAHNLRQ